MERTEIVLESVKFGGAVNAAGATRAEAEEYAGIVSAADR